jgi:DNA replication protein DnaC
MEKVSNLLRDGAKSSDEPFDLEKALLKDCERYNWRTLQPDEYDCPKCGNKGNYMYYEAGYTFLKNCECATIRQNNLNIDRSGLNKVFQQYTFENWKTRNEVHRNMKKVCEDYIDNYNGQGWLYIGGQVGSGKTHIATATLQELMKKSYVGTYKRWHEIIKELKTGMNTKDYQLVMHDLKNCNLLYIDDFLKNPTEADLNIAFEIIQARVDRQKATIITSELYLHEIKDEAIGSRINQMCGDNVIQIKRDSELNYRIKE